MGYIKRRLALAPLLLITVSFLTFWSLRLTASNQEFLQGVLGINYTDASARRLSAELGLDRPFFSQYFHWVAGLVTGDFGNSFFSRRSVWSFLKPGLATSVQLVLMSMVLGLALSIPLGIVSAYRAGTKLDRAIGLFSFGLLALPAYVIGIIVRFTFGVRLSWFPVGGSVPFAENPAQATYHLIVPSFTLALGMMSTFQRALRTDMVNSLQEDYITFAKSKGLPDRFILMRHAFRPSSFTLVTLAGINLGALIGNAFLVESLFALNGLGGKILQSLLRRDVPVVLGGVMLITFVYVLTTTAVDILYGVLDPRVRHARTVS